MSIPEGERGGPRRLAAITKAKKLAAYTIEICTNEKNFPPQFQNALTNDIIQTAKDIYLYAWQANGIRVVSDERKTERQWLQEVSIRRCNDLLALIELAQPINVKNERKKLYRMAQKVKHGEMTKD